MKKVIKIKDPIPRNDSLKGKIEIYGKDKLGKKQLLTKSNLIVYSGREWLLTAISRQDNTNLGLNSGHSTWGIYYLSLGDCSPTDPSNPPPPESTDTSLVSEYTFGDNSTAYADNNHKKPITGYTFVQDSNNSDKYLILQTSTTIDYYEISQGNVVSINEAGLWISNSYTPQDATDFLLFARVTFPTISKDDNLALEFLWYIYS